MVGPECSGRTTAALSLVAAGMSSGAVCAWIDVADVLEPESAAAIGIDVSRLLWIRCGGQMPVHARQCGTKTQSAPEPLLKAAGNPAAQGGGSSAHPRSEGRNMPEAVSAIFKVPEDPSEQHIRRGKRGIGTPGAPNRPVSSRSLDREEQPNSDRLPARRGDNLTLVPRCAEQPWKVSRLLPSKHKPLRQSDLLEVSLPTLPPNRWQALDQGLRSADLLLHNGGFSSIVLDLGSIPPEIVWRVPLATWFRFRAACERSRTSLVLLTQHSCARSSAELVLRLKAGKIEAHGNVVTGIQYSATPERSRFVQNSLHVVSIRKEALSERPGHWTSETAWA